MVRLWPVTHYLWPNVSASLPPRPLIQKMPPLIASLVFALGIPGLFWLDRDPEARTTKALWIPTLWVMLSSARPLSMWLGMGPNGGTSQVYLEGSPFDAAVLMALVAAGLAVVVARIGQVGPILRKNWPILLFFSYAAFSICWSEYPFVTFKHWIKGVGDVLMILIVSTEPNILDAIKRLVTRAGYVLLPLSVLLMKYYPDLGRVLNRSWTEEWIGVTGQKNTLGEICTVFGLGLLWRFRGVYNNRQDPKRWRQLVALGTVLGMVIWLLWMCESMTSISALVLASGVMLLSTRPTFRRKPALIHVLVITALIVPAYALFFESTGTLVGELGRDPSLTGRTEIWDVVLSIPDNRLVGAGYETFWVGSRLQQVWGPIGMDINEAHDGYIEMLLNLGWIGVALLGALIATGYRNVLGAYRRDLDIGSLRTAYLLATVITGFTEAAFRMMDPIWIFFLLATITLPVDSAPQISGGQYQSEGRLEFQQEAAVSMLHSRVSEVRLFRNRVVGNHERVGVSVRGPLARHRVRRSDYNHKERA